MKHDSNLIEYIAEGLYNDYLHKDKLYLSPPSYRYMINDINYLECYNQAINNIRQLKITKLISE